MVIKIPRLDTTDKFDKEFDTHYKFRELLLDLQEKYENDENFPYLKDFRIPKIQKFD
jgi:hypothetical protein